jgi:predicted O-linked N-acetylglucosamine transferase (SPINDLY family)
MSAIAAPRSRNDPCPCGSGQRYKSCHGREIGSGAAPTSAAPVEVPPLATAIATPADAARAALRAGRADEAVRILGADSGPPDDPVEQRLYAEAMRAIDPERSREAWTRVLASSPGDPEALFFLGDLDREAGRFEAAIARFDAALVAAPDHPALLNNLGLALEDVGRLEDAARRFERALAVAPEDLNVVANLAQNRYQRRRYDDAIPLFDRVVARMGAQTPVEIWANRGVALFFLGNNLAAEKSLARAAEIAPDTPGLWRDLGAARFEMRQWGTAITALDRAIALDPGDRYALALRHYCAGYECYWSDFGAVRASVRAAADSDSLERRSLVIPFILQSFSDDPALERNASQRWTQAALPSAPNRRPTRRRSDSTLRVGFASSDFHHHPVGRLVVGLIERLDRRRFRPLLYSTEIWPVDRTRERLMAVAETFREIDHREPQEAARAVRSDEIDILIDLAGHTGRSGAHLVSLRPAPVIVNFLGYTGTMGSSLYDWIVTDRYCVPESLAAHCVERPLYVEPCYLPSDPTREVDAASIARADYGLPVNSVVFAAPAATYKVQPEQWDEWMTILAAVDDSVLWLREATPTVVRRLREHAQARGVDPSRLHFARNDDVPRYLARFRLADLFLDTWPFGSHTTVNDALFTGLPVLARAGRNFASRASASQVRAAGLPELVVEDGPSYVDTAIALGRDRRRLRELAEALRERRDSLPLFDIDAYARRFEAALEAAWARTPVD